MTMSTTGSTYVTAISIDSTLVSRGDVDRRGSTSEPMDICFGRLQATSEERDLDKSKIWAWYWQRWQRFEARELWRGTTVTCVILDDYVSNTFFWSRLLKQLFLLVLHQYSISWHRSRVIWLKTYSFESFIINVCVQMALIRQRQWNLHLTGPSRCQARLISP